MSQGAGRPSQVPLPAGPPFRFPSTRTKRNGGQAMTTINLKDFYYWYIQDQFIEVADEVAEALTASRRQEAAYVERARYNKAYYSLDCDDGIEYSAPASMSPAPRSSWIARKCFSGSGTRSTPCRSSRAAGWMPTSFSVKAIGRSPARRAWIKAPLGAPSSAGSNA